MQNLANKHEEKISVQNELLQDERLTAIVRSELGKAQQPYSAQWRWWYLGALGFGYVGNFWSFTTQAGAVGYIAYAMLGGAIPNGLAVVVSGAAGIGLSALIELMKRDANDKFFFKLVFVRSFVGHQFGKVIFIGSISVAISFYACTLLPQALHSVPAAFDASPIQAQYAPQIAEAEAMLATYKKQSWKGRYSSETLALITEQANRLDSLRKAAATAAADAQRDYDTHNQRTAAEQTAWGWMLGWITAGVELLFMAAFWFTKRYLLNSALERGLIEAQVDTPDDKKAAQSPPQLEQNEQRIQLRNASPSAASDEIAPLTPRRRIGFLIPTPIAPIINEQDAPLDAATQCVTQSQTEAPKPHNSRDCAHCSKAFTYKTTWQKYCSEACRVASWEKRNGKKFRTKNK